MESINGLYTPLNTIKNGLQPFDRTQHSSHITFHIFPAQSSTRFRLLYILYREVSRLLVSWLPDLKGSYGKTAQNPLRQ